MKGLYPELCGDDTNKIDMQTVLKLCPSWKKPMEERIPCTVFRRELEEACPDLPGFLSQVGNKSHHNFDDSMPHEHSDESAHVGELEGQRGSQVKNERGEPSAACCAQPKRPAAVESSMRAGGRAQTAAAATQRRLRRRGLAQ